MAVSLFSLCVSALQGDVRDQPIIRVRPPNGGTGGTGFRTMWCAPAFELDANGPECSREDVDGVEGAFLLSDVLSREEAARMVEMAELMGFERDGDGDAAGRSNGACSWCFHDALADQLIRRIARLLPWAVAVHSPGTDTPTAEQLPSLQGTPPWVRQIGGCPEGMYTLDGLNTRMRLYRYDSDTTDHFLPHFDECWPGSRVVLGGEGGEAVLEQDYWKYSDGSTMAATCKWSWSTGERVSHLTVLLYLNDDFDGGETVMYPGSHPSEVPPAGSEQIAVRPVAGSMLCFGQSFKFNRKRVEHAPDAVLHEGAPLRGVEHGAAKSKYVLRTDVCYALPYRG